MEILEPVLTAYGIVIRLAGVTGALLVIILVHEMGHYLVGRWCGIGASVFSIGFGPELCGVTDRRGTRWRMAAVPFGGYVRFAGDPDAAGISSGERQGENLRRDSFATANAWKRVATVLAGPVFNILFTVAVLSALFFVSGRAVIAPVVTDVLPESPAARAGFRPGDRIVNMQGQPVSSFEEISRYVMSHDGDPVHFIIKRQGRSLAMNVMPQMQRVDDGFGNTIRIGRIGITGSNEPENTHRIDFNVFEAVGQGVRESAFIVSRSVEYIGRLIKGRGDRCQLIGPVRSVQIAWKISDFGFYALMHFAAIFSISIGFFNLLPIPPLDGGHLVFYLVEGLVGRPVPPVFQQFFFRVGLFVLLLFMIFAILNNYIPC